MLFASNQPAPGEKFVARQIAGIIVGLAAFLWL